MSILSARTASMRPASLLRSQFEALEEPGADENAVVVSIEPSPKVIADRILAALGIAVAFPGVKTSRAT